MMLQLCVEPAADGTSYRQATEVNSLSRTHPLGGRIERVLAHRLVAPTLRHVVTNLKFSLRPGSTE